MALLLAGCRSPARANPHQRGHARLAHGRGHLSRPDRRRHTGRRRQARGRTQERLRSRSQARPIAAGDGNTQRYWSALEPLRQRFARVPNPDLVMVVYPHLAKGKYPVPGYVTVFRCTSRPVCAPRQVAEDLIAGHARYQVPRLRPRTPAPSRRASP